MQLQGACSQEAKRLGPIPAPPTTQTDMDIIICQLTQLNAIAYSVFELATKIKSVPSQTVAGAEKQTDPIDVSENIMKRLSQIREMMEAARACLAAFT